MVKKLLLKVLTFWALLLTSALGWGQCVDTAPTVTITNTTGSSSLCKDGTTTNSPITFNSSVTSNSVKSYQWQVQVGSGDWNNIANANEATLSYDNAALGSNRIRLQVTYCLNSDPGQDKTISSTPSGIITVYEKKEGTITIAASNTNLCPGETVTFSTSNPGNLGATPTYSWRVNGTQQGTGATFSSSSLKTGDDVQLFVTSTVPCVDLVESNVVSFTEKSGTPGTPAAFTTGETEVCPGTTQTYTVPNDPTASEYIWTKPPGWTGNSSTNSITLTAGNSGSGDITVQAKNSCGTSEARTIAVSVKAGTPATPGTISGTAEVCPGVAQTFSISTVTGASSYNWTFPTGWTGSSTSTSITLTPTAGSAQNGNLSVTATNTCGTSTARTLGISMKPGTPAQPAAFSSGPAALCPGAQGTYSVPNVTGATSYVWTLPTGFSAPSLTTSTPSLVVTAGNSGTGNITVKASNDCGTGTAQTFAVEINDPAPVMTGAIQGSPAVCANISELKYSIPAITNAESYEWAVTGSGWQITSGNGTNEITVTAGTTGGTISVIAKNSCGDSASKSITVGLNPPAPAVPGTITFSDGTDKACLGTAETYTFTGVPNASSYLWTLPNGSTQTTTSPSLTYSATAAGTQTLKVAAVNTCGTSTENSFQISVAGSKPAQPGPITASKYTVCPPETGFTLTVPSATDADSYQWFLPTGWEITGGNGTNSITVKINASSNYQNPTIVGVEAINNCGNSVRRNTPADITDPNAIAVSDFVFVNLGEDRLLCNSKSPITIPASLNFGGKKLKIASVRSSSGTTLPVPSGAVDSHTINYTPSDADLANGKVTITLTTESPGGACSAGKDEVVLNFRPVPSASIATTNAICAGTSTDLTVTGTSNTILTYRIGTGTDKTVNIGSDGTATINTGILNTTSTFNLRSIKFASDPICSTTLTSSTTVNVTPIPTASISYPSSPFCSSANTSQAVSLNKTGTTTGAAFSAPNGLIIDSNSGAITPEGSTPGTYLVTYTIPAFGGCENVTATTEVVIVEKVVITEQPSGKRVCAGENLLLSVSATGEGLTYKWFKGAVGSGTAISGATTNTLNLNTVSTSDAGSYYVEVSGTSPCTKVSSQAVELVVDDSITINTQPASATTCLGGSATLSVNATAGNAALNYQWYKGTPGSSTAVGVNSASLEISDATTADIGSYYVVVSGPDGFLCEPVTSQTSVLNVRETPTVEISGTTEVCDGGSTDLFFSNGTPNAIVSYTLNNGALQNITLDAAGEATLSTGALSVSNNEVTSYTYAVTGIEYADAPDCTTTITGSAIVTVNPTPNANVSFENNQVSFCNSSDENGQPKIFTPTLVDGTGAYENGIFSAEGLSVDENTGAFSPSGVTPGNYTLKYFLTGAGGCSDLLATLDVVIYEQVKITSQPFPVAVCTANSTQLEMAATGDNLSYQWYKVGTTSDSEVGTDSPILELKNAIISTGGDYYVVVSGDNACTSVKSETVTVTVDENIVIAAENQPDSQDICAGDEATLRIAATASGDNTAIQYQWEYRATAQDAWSDFGTAETGDLFSEISTGQAGEYRARIDGPDGFSCDTGYSQIVQVKTYEAPSANAGADFQACSTNTAISLKGTDASVSNYSSLEWTTPNGAGTITNATSLDATYEPAAADYNKEIEFTLTAKFEINGTEPCSAAVSSKKIKILPLPEITSFSYNGTEFCETDPQTQAPTVTGNYFAPGDGTYSVNPTTGLNLATTGVINPNGSTPGDYTITYTAPSNGVCTEAVTATFDVTIGEKPIAAFSYVESPYCSNTSNPSPTLETGAVAGAFSSTSGLVFADASTGEINIAASTPGTYTVTNTITSNNGCAEVKSTAEVTITKLPVAEFSYAGSPYCSNAGNATVTLGNGAENGLFTSTTGLSLNSTTGEVNISSSTPGTYTVTNTIPAANGCGDVVYTSDITITKLPVADFEYASTAYCKSAANPLPEFLNGGAAGTFSSTTGLVINSSTGEIDLAASTAGTYTVTNTFTAAGGCAEVAKTFNIQIDPISFGGTSILASLDDKDEYETPAPARLVTACHLGSGEIEVSDDYVGEIIRWESSVDAINWTTINGTADQNLNPYRFTGIETTTLYRAVIKSGECSESYSPVSIISVIPADIKPNPVTASPAEVCIGTGTTLTSESGYATGSYLQGGDFQTGQLNTQDPNGWLVDGSPGGYTASADNTKANHWAGTNPHTFGTQRFDSGDPKFAIANGGLTTVLETPVINSIGLTEFHFGFDQAYNLNTGDKILVELSLDGGKTYVKVLQEITGPASSTLFNTFANDNTNFDLSQYVGQPQVRIKFTYIGKNAGSAWALDNFKFPDEPVGLETVWYNAAGVEIGRTEDITIPATDLKPGVNTFAVTSYINGCRSEGEGGTTYVDVYAWNHYTGGAGEDQTLSCGIVETILDAELIPAYIDPANPDDRTSLENSGGLWTVSSSTPSGLTFEFEDPTNPKTKFTGEAGTYVLTWTINNEGPCTVEPDTVNITFSDCIALDFDGFDDRVAIDHPETGDPYSNVKSIEAWILPKTTGGTIISGPTFKVTTPSEVNPDSRWYHIAVSGGRLYIDGIDKGELSLGEGGSKTLIGAEWIDGIDGEPGAAENFFHGWIEEVRLWKKELDTTQIRFMMNQRLIDNGAEMGEQIPMDVPGGLTYSDLAGYYRLISAEPEPLTESPVVYLAEDMPANGMTPDRAANKVPGRLVNMETNQENTAPLPYYSGANGVWGTDATWLRPDVWDPPHTGAIEWNIARTSHNITSGGRDILLLGLISEANTLDMEGEYPTNSWIAGGTGNQLFLSHYLLLNGLIDLNGESQLVQPMGSIVDESSTGLLYRDQQGTASSYNYNYWSSPVSPKSTLNKSYTVASVLGSYPDDVDGVQFGEAYSYADGPASNPIKISTYWLHRFHGTANNYFEWDWIGASEPLAVGEGYSMKGTAGPAAILDAQNYTFRGIPNNGDITPGTTKTNENYLIGNPYPSAIDADRFIADNLNLSYGGELDVFNGTIYFWSHFAEKTHYLEEYVGGYAAYNFSGGVMAVSVDDRIDNSNPNRSGGQVPQQFIPVGQAFFVNTMSDSNLDSDLQADGLPDVSGGPVIFKNSQRVFVKESSESAVFHSQEKKDLMTGSTNSSSQDVEQNKIWLKFKSPKGFHRQILVTADPRSTNNFDFGFDAPMIDENVEDMYWYFNKYQFVIQGVPDFNIERVLDLGINVEQKGALSISIDDLDNIPDEMNIYLADSLNQVVHDLRAEPYETESEAGTFTDRFKLVFQDKTQIEEPEVPIIEEGPFEVLYVTGTRNVLLRNPELLEVDRVYLNNMLGQQVHVYYNVPSEKEVELPVKRFSAGVYIVKVHYEGGIITRKVILE